VQLKKWLTLIKKILRKLILRFSSLYSNNKESKVIFYHDIYVSHSECNTSTSLDLFKKHLACIANLGFEIVMDITNSTSQIKIQLDDGFSGIFEVYEFLEKNKIPIEIFIITSKIGEKGFLDKDQIKKMNESDYVRFSSHTHTHADLSPISKDSLKYELETSKILLEELLSSSVGAICYPRGIFSKEVIDRAKELGYKEQYSSLPGSFRSGINDKVFNRNLVQFCDTQELKYILKGGLAIFHKRYWRRHYKL
jgi:peptidoglycan/xylan/chitin deacetylase (PgdA/CDA1 family)